MPHWQGVRCTDRHTVWHRSDIRTHKFIGHPVQVTCTGNAADTEHQAEFIDVFYEIFTLYLVLVSFLLYGRLLAFYLVYYKKYRIF